MFFEEILLALFLLIIDQQQLKLIAKLFILSDN